MHVGGAEATPVRGIWVVLHQVTLAGGAPVDSGRTDRGGRYRVQSPALDTGAVYIVSVTYAGIAYFSRPVHPVRGVPLDTAETLTVYDTSSTTPRIELAQRHLIVRRPEGDGSRHVLELLVLRNNGLRTRIAPDTSRPVWAGVLPLGAIQFQVGESDVSSEAVYRRGDSVAVAAPVPPGEKQVVVSYILPRSVPRLQLPLDQAVGRVNLLVEDSAATLEGDALDRMGAELIEGVSFQRFARSDVAAGTPVSLRFARGRFAPASLWWVVVSLAGLVLLSGLMLVWRRTRVPADLGPASSDPAVLAAQIAALDAVFEARADPSPADRKAYQRRREWLKSRLQDLLRHPPA